MTGKTLVLTRCTDDLSVHGIDRVFGAMAAVLEFVGAVIQVVLAVDAEIGARRFWVLWNHGLGLQ